MRSGQVFRRKSGAVREVDLETPRQLRRPAVQLLIEIVAPTADRLGHCESGHDRIEQHQQVEVLDPSHDDHGDRTARDHAPDRETALPDLVRAGEALGVPVVSGEQVVHPRADNAADHDRDEDLTDLLARAAPLDPALLGDLAAAASTPSASIRPYACSSNGPISMTPRDGLGMEASSIGPPSSGRVQVSTTSAPISPLHKGVLCCAFASCWQRCS